MHSKEIWLLYTLIPSVTEFNTKPKDTWFSLFCDWIAYRKELQCIINVQSVQGSRKVGKVWQDNTGLKFSEMVPQYVWYHGLVITRMCTNNSILMNLFANNYKIWAVEGFPKYWDSFRWLAISPNPNSRLSDSFKLDQLTRIIYFAMQWIDNSKKKVFLTIESI